MQKENSLKRSTMKSTGLKNNTPLFLFTKKRVISSAFYF